VQTWVEPQWPALADTPLLRFVVYVAATLALGCALYLGVERPGLHWRDKFSAIGNRKNWGISPSPHLHARSHGIDPGPAGGK